MSILESAGKEGKVAPIGAAKEATKTGLGMPSTQRTQAKLPGGPLARNVGAKEAIGASLPAKGLSVDPKQEKLANAPKEQVRPGAPASSGEPSQTSSRTRGPSRVTLPTAGTKPVGPTASRKQEAEDGKGASDAPGTPAERTAPEGEQPRIAVLSAEVKAELVRAVRQRIADQAGWLPAKVKNATAYAGKMEGGEVVLVDASSTEATRFSLVGAFLRELDVRRVITTATGRREFLDEEIPEAIRQVLLEGVSDEDRKQAAERLSSEDLELISHGQCLAVLDVLESQNLQQAEDVQVEKAKRSLGTARLPDLVKKLKENHRLSPEEVATALYHELMEVRRRLDRLESSRNLNK